MYFNNLFVYGYLVGAKFSSQLPFFSVHSEAFPPYRLKFSGAV